MIVTPICPHALSARSIVLGRERTVSIKMGKQSRKTAYLSVDGGKAFRLGSGDVGGAEDVQLQDPSGTGDRAELL